MVNKVKNIVSMFLAVVILLIIPYIHHHHHLDSICIDTEHCCVNNCDDYSQNSSTDNHTNHNEDDSFCIGHQKYISSNTLSIRVIHVVCAICAVFNYLDLYSFDKDNEKTIFKSPKFYYLNFVLGANSLRAPPYFL